MPLKNTKNYYLAQAVADKFGISKKTLLGGKRRARYRNLPRIGAAGGCMPIATSTKYGR